MSLVECHTRKISKFIDHYSHLHLKALSSYVKDTSDIINKNSETENILKDKFLVTSDVRSLFTDMANHEGT